MDSNACASINVFSDSELRTLCHMARSSAFEVCLDAGHGHIGASSSSVELMVALYFGGILRLDSADPLNASRDRVLVRGHLGPLRYSLFSYLGWVSQQELKTYRRLGSRLAGHEDHTLLPGVDITPSGSLGMLLSYGVGCATALKDSGSLARVFVFLGDGEEQEGNVSEAARYGAHLGHTNLVAIVDKNKKQLSNSTKENDSASLEHLWQGYGWNTVELQNGNSVVDAIEAYRSALEASAQNGKPTLLIAHTTKGLGVDGAAEHFSGYHTLSRVDPQLVQQSVSKIRQEIDPEIEALILEKLSQLSIKSGESRSDLTPTFDLSTPAPLNLRNNPDACQFDYFKILPSLPEYAALRAGGLYFLTADVTTEDTVQALRLNETFRFHNVGLREQHMIAMAHGISITLPSARIIVNSFDAFAYRCFDQLNAAVQGRANIIMIGDVSGITNGRNGRTHQPPGVAGALQFLEGAKILEPSSALEMFRCLDWAISNNSGLVYLRVFSSDAAHVQPCGPENLEWYYVRRSDEPKVVFISSGLLVAPCTEASDFIAGLGIHSCVINVVDVSAGPRGAVSQIPSGALVVVAYNGNSDALLVPILDEILHIGTRFDVLKIDYRHGATGTVQELMAKFSFGHENIVDRVMERLNA